MLDKILKKLYNAFKKSGKMTSPKMNLEVQKMPEITKDVIAEMNKRAPLNMEKAQEIAKKFGFDSYRSITASAKRNGIEYVNKARVAKNGKPVTSKTELVEAVAQVLNVNLEGMEKATKQSLETLSEAVFTMAEDLSDSVDQEGDQTVTD